MITGLRRSCIYVPGDVEKMLAGATALPSDMLLLNLEDGVADSRKADARANVTRSLGALDFGRREVVVRVNSLDPGVGREDLAAVVPARPDGICLPKVESSADIMIADAALRELEIRHEIPPGTVRIHAMIESAGGILSSPEIASASTRMASLIFGSADYVQDVGVKPGEDRAELLFPLQMVVTAARAAGIDAMDAPCFDLRNLDLLRREAAQGRRIGFEGKSALHPLQLPVINEAFGVTEDEVAWARRVLAELDTAERRGRALTTLDGRLIDNPHRVAAERILRRAARAGISEEAR
jgi:citrate lyase subunit beta/citryl-CoA lyase